MKTRSVSSKSTKSTIAKTATRDMRGTRISKAPSVATKSPPYEEPSVCESCSAVYARRTWRSDRPLTHALLDKATWTKCPACKQKRSGVAYGRVIAKGTFDARRLAAIERRVNNVAARAGFTQPERAIISMDRTDSGLDVLTTSQKLAHRIVHELKKAFGGRARYVWADRDGALLATWSG